MRQTAAGFGRGLSSAGVKSPSGPLHIRTLVGRSRTAGHARNQPSTVFKCTASRLGSDDRTMPKLPGATPSKKSLQLPRRRAPAAASFLATLFGGFDRDLPACHFRLSSEPLPCPGDRTIVRSGDERRDFRSARARPPFCTIRVHCIFLQVAACASVISRCNRGTCAWRYSFL